MEVDEAAEAEEEGSEVLVAEMVEVSDSGDGVDEEDVGENGPSSGEEAVGGRPSAADAEVKGRVSLDVMTADARSIQRGRVRSVLELMSDRVLDGTGNENE